jgi:hypothetical protein
MADDPENHTLRLLREMREENLRLHSETREQLGKVLETVIAMAKTVNATEDRQRDCGSRDRTQRPR